MTNPVTFAPSAVADLYHDPRAHSIEAAGQPFRSAGRGRYRLASPLQLLYALDGTAEVLTIETAAALGVLAEGLGLTPPHAAA
jgi:hypothetical protein